MKFSIEASDLKEAARFALSAIAKHPTSPIMGGILLTVSENSMTASGSDYEKVAAHTVPVTAEAPIVLLVRGDYLNKLVAKFNTSKAVMVTVEEKRVTMSQGRLKFSIPRMDPDEYPTDLVGATQPIGHVNGESFAKMIRSGSVSVSNDYTLAILTSVRLELGAEIKAMSTDRYRLSFSNTDWEPVSETEYNVSVAGDWIREVAKTVAGETELFIGVSGHGEVNRFGVTSGPYTTSVSLAAGDYPKIRGLLANNRPMLKTRINRKQFIEAIDAVTVMLERNIPVIFENADCEMTIHSGGENGDSTVTVETDQDEAIKFGLNPSFLLDIVRSIDNDTVILSPDPTKPMWISAEGEDAEHLVMPVRLTPANSR